MATSALRLRSACSRYNTRLLRHPPPPIYSHVRTFSASAPRRDVIDVLTFIPRSIMNIYQYAGLPWWAIIPLTALTMRTAFTYHTVKNMWEVQRLRRVIQPLANVSTFVRLRAEDVPTDPRALKTAKARVDTERKARAYQMEVFNAMGASNGYRPYLWNFGVLLMGSEAVRMKLGCDEGLLGLLTRSLTYAAEKFRIITPTVPMLDGKPMVPLNIDPIPLQEELDIASANLDPLLPQFDIATTMQGVSFCPDLTVADPSGMMSLLLFLVMTYNVILRPSRSHAATVRDWAKTFGVLDMLQLVVGTAFLVFTTNMPAGILYYITWSIIGNKLLNIWFAIRSPLPRLIEPCTVFAPRYTRKAAG